MEPSEAISTKAAERYLLGELTDADADAFEEHFFDCVLCADDVRDEARIIEAGRAVAREGTPNVVPIDSRRSSRRGWLQVAAAAILVIGLSPIWMMRRAAPAARVVQQAIVSADRGDRNPITALQGQMLVLVVDVNPGDYRWKVTDVSGTSRAHGTANRADTVNGLNLWPGELPAGSYTLVVDGVREDGNAVVETRHFTIRR